MSLVFRYCYVTVIFVIEKLDTDLVIIMNLILVCHFFSTDGPVLILHTSSTRNTCGMKVSTILNICLFRV